MSLSDMYDMTPYTCSQPHGAEVIDIYMTNNIIDDMKYKEAPLKINNNDYYYK